MENTNDPCVSEEDKDNEKREKWEKATGFKKFFMYHPDTSHLTRAASLLWLIPALGVLAGAVLLMFLFYYYITGDIVGYEKEVVNLPTYIYGMTVGLIALLVSYGIAHLKKWSIYLSSFLLVVILLITGEFYSLGLIAFVLTLIDWKRFR